MLTRLAVATLLILCSMFAVAAQTSRPPDVGDAINALVAELRALRVELVDGNQRSLRFQLLLARLQLQEQRIGHLDRQRAEVSRTLLEVSSIAGMFTAQYEQFERSCADASGDERKACDAQRETMKSTATSHQQREQQLRLQEQELVQAIGTEQGRWADFSSRLDELERALTRR
jgi:hypothetical protein